ncbi:hypothetical protein ACFL20_04375 [Spirochaetota bacterium]
MTFNLAPRIIVNILFYNLFESYIKILDYNSIAISPISECAIKTLHANHVINMQTLIKNFNILIEPENITTGEDNFLSELLSKTSVNVQGHLQILLRKNLKIKYNKNSLNVKIDKNYKKIVIALTNTKNRGGEKFITLYLPTEFFRFFSKKIDDNFSTESIGKEVLNFFINPKWILPNLKSILISLNNIELNKLINQLQKNNLLTIYQIYLIIQAFPELSIKLKRVLSKNTISDVMDMKKNEVNLKLEKRDIAGGVYSVEEAIHFLIKAQADFNYSKFLNNIQKIVKIVINMDIILRKNFDDWIDEITGNDLLYKTITVTKDNIVAGAISKESEKYFKKFKNHISKRKIQDIKSMINNDLSYNEIMISKMKLILNYRKLRMKKQTPGIPSLEYLLIHFTRESDYNFLLQSVGWFTLSTALKGVKRINVKKILENLPGSCALLMEDVIKGIVNPNILHDEMQISKAKKICADSIIQLYDDGIIELE